MTPTSIFFAFMLMLFVIERAVIEWRRRWVRSVLEDLSIDGLFDAVSNGHLSSTEAAEEIIRRHCESKDGCP